MALAYKCDICGKLFEPEVDRLNEIILSHICIENGANYRQYTMQNTKITCPDCMNYFIEYIKKYHTNKNELIKEADTNETNN